MRNPLSKMKTSLGNSTSQALNTTESHLHSSMGNSAYNFIGKSRGLMNDGVSPIKRSSDSRVIAAHREDSKLQDYDIGQLLVDKSPIKKMSTEWRYSLSKNIKSMVKQVNR